MTNITYIHKQQDDKDKLVVISKQLAILAEEYSATLAGVEIHIAIAHICASILKINDQNS